MTYIISRRPTPETVLQRAGARAEQMNAIPYTPLKKGQIRLLRLTPGNWKIKTIFHLETYDIDHVPLYFALSYTWGDPDEVGGTIWYQPGGIEVVVTTNLFYGLHRLQADIHHNHVAYVWVDALCINQDDNTEKALQIPLMRRIFAEAEHVLAWLGIATREEELAVQTINVLWPQLRAVKDQYRSVGSWFERVDNVARLLPPADDAFWPRFLELVAKSWHNRVWTVQEACVDTSVTFIVGVEGHISFPDFMGFVAMVRAARSNGVGFLYNVLAWNPSPAARTELIRRLISRYREKREKLLEEVAFLSTLDRYLSDLLEGVYNVDRLRHQVLGPDTPSLRHLLFKAFYGRDCSVLSDRVAAMAGILTPSLALDASLDLTTNEAFMLASRTWWLHDPELTFLHFVDPHRKSKSHPSWVLDFKLLQHAPIVQHGLDQEYDYRAGGTRHTRTFATYMSKTCYNGGQATSLSAIGIV
ncbi:hypothetical protein LTR86_007725 [Recurvomyces mirabilis]|nr:hypothetical protein LTR86_007725 [Recurvomyces mirabilis]